MSELLASSKTKRSITDLLIQQVTDHMTTRNKDYVIAGNHKTFLSQGGYTNEEKNDHKEADILIILCLGLVDDFIKYKIADTDVFLSLLSHSDKMP